MRRNGFAPIIILILIAFGIAGYFGYKYVKTNPNALPFISSPETSGSIEDWETYTDTDIGYTIKYPASWFMLDGVISNVKRPLPDDKGTVLITFYSTDKSITDLDLLFDSKLKNAKSMEGDPAFLSYESKSSTTVAGYPALKISGKGYGGNYIKYLIANPDTNRIADIHIIFQKGDFEHFQQTFDQILSTFKFIN